MNLKDVAQRTIVFDTENPSAVYDAETNKPNFSVTGHGMSFENFKIQEQDENCNDIIKSYPGFYVAVTSPEAGEASNKGMTFSYSSFKRNSHQEPMSLEELDVAGKLLKSYEIKMDLVAFFSNYPYDSGTDGSHGRKKAHKLSTAIVDIESYNNDNPNYRTRYACFDNNIARDTQYTPAIEEDWKQPSHKMGTVHRNNITSNGTTDNPTMATFTIFPNFKKTFYKSFADHYGFENKNPTEFPMYIGIQSITLYNLNEGNKDFDTQPTNAPWHG